MGAHCALTVEAMNELPRCPGTSPAPRPESWPGAVPTILD